MANTPDFATYEQFWPFYLSQHSKPKTRCLHAIGTMLGLLAIALAIIFFSPAWLLAAPVIGYGFAWVAHAFIEKNHPATFTYPLWSLRGDVQMTWFWLTGRLASELAKHNIRD